MRLTNSLSAVAAVSSLLLAACSGGSDDAVEPASAPTTASAAVPTTAAVATTKAATATTAALALLAADNNQFKAVSAAPGQTVRLVSGDPVPHTAVSETGAWTFDDRTAQFTAPAAAGSYPFFCGVHGKSMSGTLVVK